jgi:hypothetical protein
MNLMSIKDLNITSLLGVLLSFWLILPSALGAQNAITSRDGSIYRKPSLTSEVVTRLREGTHVTISSKYLQDSSGRFWFKIQVPNIGYGFVQGNDVMSQEGIRELSESAIQSTAVYKTDLDLEPSYFQARVAGMMGGELQTGVFEANLEGEISRTIPLAEKGRFQKFLSLGAAFLAFNNRQPAIMGSIIIQPSFKLPLDLNPELRLRLGWSTSSPFLYRD